MSGCETANLFRQDIKGMKFFSEIFGNYCKILSESETTNIFRQVFKGMNFFSEIFGNYWKLLSAGCETTNLVRQVLKRVNFFFEIIGKYCRGARRKISSDRFIKGEFYSKIFGNYWKILLECETTNLFRQVLKG